MTSKEHRPIAVLATAALATSMLLASSQSLFAEPVTLVCTGDPGETVTSGVPVTYDLDEARGTVTINWPVTTVPNGRYPPIVHPAGSATLPATFSPKAITFDRNYDTGDYNHYVIDRLTGRLTMLNSTGAAFETASPKDRSILHGTCHVGKAEF